MLGKRSGQKGMFDAEFLCGDRIAAESFYGFLASTRDELFRDEDFEALYSRGMGRPSVPPSVLALALLLQAHDRVSDQEACERSQFDLRWSYALGTEAGVAPFAKSTFQQFRAKLLIHEEGETLFRRSLEYASEEGYLKGRPLRLAVDTTPILGRAAVKDTYNLLADGIRKVLRAMATAQGEPVEAWAEAHGYERYFAGSIKGQAEIEWDDESQRRAFLSEIVQDAAQLVEAVGRVESEGHRERLTGAARLLSDLLQQDVIVDEDGAKIRRGVAKDRIVSVQDPQMRHGRKSKSNRFDGYKGVVAVDSDSQVITSADVVPANTHDGDTALPVTKASEEATGQPVEETIGDAAYGDSSTRAAFADQERRLVAKVPGPNRAGGRFAKTDFVIEMEQERCTCPAGEVTQDLRMAGFHKDRHGKRWPRRAFHFPTEVCRDCPLRPQCTRNTRGRTVMINEREAELQEARALQKSEAFGEYRRRRQVSEHRIARLTQLGIRQSRYFGIEKTRFQVLLAAAVANFTLVANARFLAGPSNGLRRAQRLLADRISRTADALATMSTAARERRSPPQRAATPQCNLCARPIPAFRPRF